MSRTPLRHLGGDFHVLVPVGPAFEQNYIVISSRGGSQNGPKSDLPGPPGASRGLLEPPGASRGLPGASRGRPGFSRSPAGASRGLPELPGGFSELLGASRNLPGPPGASRASHGLPGPSGAFRGFPELSGGLPRSFVIQARPTTEALTQTGEASDSEDPPPEGKPEA